MPSGFIARPLPVELAKVTVPVGTKPGRENEINSVVGLPLPITRATAVCEPGATRIFFTIEPLGPIVAVVPVSVNVPLEIVNRRMGIWAWGKRSHRGHHGLAIVANIHGFRRLARKTKGLDFIRRIIDQRDG